MGDWMAAADALVHSTGGLTILEAHIRGCAPISYGWGRGHLRPNNAAFVRYGIAEVVTTRARAGERRSAAPWGRPGRPTSPSPACPPPPPRCSRCRRRRAED